MSEQIIILGSGPAGLTAAMYASRAGLSPIVLSGNLPGGLLTQTSIVENFPGFPDFVEGFDLMERMKAQAKKLGAKVVFKNATAVELSQNGPHIVKFASGEPLSARALILATGSRPRELGVPGETELRNRGVSYCATCDGPLYRGKDVVVVGGGDTALEEALYLANLAKSVTLVHRRDAFRASQAMVDRVLASTIHVAWNSTIHEIRDIATGRVTSVTLRNTQDGTLTELSCDAVFLAVGHLPDTALFQGQLDLEQDGSIHLTNPPSTATSVPGVFAAGDCADPVYRQAINAAAAGCRAAMDASRWLQSLS
ncbi:MAG: thioredoxin-disulfide reductase [Victivallales bacterium]|nr:thioredoxin-disulfide reductase [Victivallales bacterium]